MFACRARRPFAAPAALLGLLLVLSGCASTVKVRPIAAEATYQWVQRALPAADEPSAATLQILRVRGLDAVWKTRPSAALAAIERSGTTDRATRFAAVELSLLAARSAEPEKSEERTALYLDAAAQAWDYLFARRPRDPPPGFDQGYAPAAMIYADAVARVVQALEREGSGRNLGVTIAVPGQARAYTLSEEGGAWHFVDFKTLVAVDRFAVRGLPERFVRYGIGAPFAGLLQPDGRTPGSAYFPPKGLGVPVTAVFRFAPAPTNPGGAPRHIGVELLDPRTQPNIEIAAHAIPTAADFTAPYGYLASVGEHTIRTLGSKGMFSPGKTGSYHRLILMAPYDPDKTPLVLIHGLWSDPSIWLPLTNRIEGDPRLSRAYQVWYFIYPSGEPFLWTAAMLRASLDDIRRTLDPRGLDPAMRDMVLLGHSMGGLLAKTTVAASGDTLWNTIFAVAPARLDLPEAQRAAIENALVFTARPYVRRVIFLSTAQRGCRMAKSLIGRIASALIKLPKPFSDMLRSVARTQPQAVRPEMRKLLQRGGADAVRVLRPDNPVMRAFAAIPIAPGVPYHSIIGDRGRDGGEDASDGVVSYRSAHLAGAESETVVPCDHHDAACPAADNEIVRILRQALVERGELRTAAHPQ